MNITRYTVIAAAVAVSAAALTGCSSDTSTPDVTVSGSESAAADTRVGDPSTWTPEVVTPSSEPIPMVQGQYISLDGMPELPEGFSILADTSDKEIVSLSNIGPDDYAMVYAKGVGEATVKVFFENRLNQDIESTPVATYTFTVRPFDPSEVDPDWVFNDTPDMGSDPATWTPAVITPSMTDMEMVLGQFAFIDPTPVEYDASVILNSSNPKVVEITEIGGGTDTLRAAQVGSTVLTVVDSDGVGEFMKVNITVIPNPNMP